MGMLEELVMLLATQTRPFSCAYCENRRRRRCGEGMPSRRGMNGAGQVALTVRVDKRNKCGSVYEHTAVKEVLSRDAKTTVWAVHAVTVSAPRGLFFSGAS